MIYKQAIIPILDYSGFMVLSLNIMEKRELQIMQNDALKLCYNVQLSDKISIQRLHKRVKLSSLEHRRIIHSCWDYKFHCIKEIQIVI